jgi:hypothetical protein
MFSRNEILHKIRNTRAVIISRTFLYQFISVELRI